MFERGAAIEVRAIALLMMADFSLFNLFMLSHFFQYDLPIICLTPIIQGLP